MVFLLVFISSASANAPLGIYNNGAWGIYIDINSSPYTDYSQVPTWGSYAYGSNGCAWFATSRLTQLTGKQYTIYDGASWWDSKYSVYGFTRGTDYPTGKALVCYQGHIAVWEACAGDTALISQGGDTWYDGYNGGNAAEYGYCSIREMSKAQVKTYTSGFLGFVYINGIENSPRIDATNFPDANFRKYVLEQIDQNKDGKLSNQEIADTTSIDCSNSSIANLKGIEFFKNLETLRCYENKLTALDVSKNTVLTTLECKKNQLTSLKVNTNLTKLDCGDNKLTSLNISKSTKLTYLRCYNNKLTTLAISHSPELEELRCFGNKINNLDVTKCKKLSSIVKNSKRGRYNDKTNLRGETDSDGFYRVRDGYRVFELFSVDHSTTVIAGNYTSKPVCISVKGLKYELDHNKKTAVFYGTKDKNTSSISIPATIKSDGKTYKVTEIAVRACRNFTKLTKLTIGKNVASIGRSAFNGCKKLKTINIKSEKLKKSGIGDACFQDINAKATFKCPKKLMKKYKNWLVKIGLAPKKVKFK